MFHHRIATQFYRAWRKYRFPVGFKKGGIDDVSRCLISLVGLGIGNADIEQRIGTRKLLSMSDSPVSAPARLKVSRAYCNTPCPTRRSQSPSSIPYGFA